MITKYTFSLKNNNKTNNTNSCFFCGACPKSTKTLDDYINDDIMAKNSWLYGDTNKKTIKINIDNPTCMSNIYSYFNGFKFSNSCPYEEDKIYYLADGTPFYFTKDYITIGFNTYYFYEFGNPIFISGLTKKMKKTIATIYIDGLKITIKK
jgi:hypothetical protein